MERIVLSADGKGFMFAQSKKPFRPWGVNYGNHGRLMEDFWNASGWIWHYDGRTVSEYDALEREKKLTIAQAIWRDALRSFIRLRPEFTTSRQ